MGTGARCAGPAAPPAVACARSCSCPCRCHCRCFALLPGTTGGAPGITCRLRMMSWLTGSRPSTTACGDASGDARSRVSSQQPPCHCQRLGSLAVTSHVLGSGTVQPASYVGAGSSSQMTAMHALQRPKPDRSARSSPKPRPQHAAPHLQVLPDLQQPRAQAAQARYHGPHLRHGARRERDHERCGNAPGLGCSSSRKDASRASNQHAG